MQLMKHMNCRFLTALLVTLLFIPTPCLCAEESDTVPAVFPTAEKWTGKDYRQAVAYLTRQSEIDPMNLPRAGDEDERFETLIGKLKLISDTMDTTGEDNWKDTYDEDSKFNAIFGNGVLIPIFKAYSVPVNRFNVVYEREILALLPLVIKSMGSNIKSLRLFVGDRMNDAPDTWPDGFQNSLTRLTKANGPVTNAVIRVLIHPGQLHPEMRSSTLKDCQEPLSNMLWAMNKADREMANDTLELLKMTIEDPADKIIIDALINTKRLPPEKLKASETEEKPKSN